MILKFVLTKEILISISLTFAILLPFALPHMHERYYYFADIMSILYIFYYPKKFYIPVIIWASSLISIVAVLFDISYFPIELLSIAVLIAVILTVGDLWISVCNHPIKQIAEIAPEGSIEKPEISENENEEITDFAERINSEKKFENYNINDYS